MQALSPFVAKSFLGAVQQREFALCMDEIK
jgi:hypothetical protein